MSKFCGIAVITSGGSENESLTALETNQKARAYRKFVDLKLSIKLLVLLALVLSAANRVFSQSNCGPSDLFTNKDCAGDNISPEEKLLYDLVNDYRSASGLPRVKLSRSLSLLANRRLLDLNLNMKKLTHSWSNCPYEMGDRRSWGCVIDAPTRLRSGYTGQGFETLYQASAVAPKPKAALDTWKKSNLHNSIILNRDMFSSRTWDEFGVGISGPFAVLWFGDPGARSVPAAQGVPFDTAMAGLRQVFTFKESKTPNGTAWSGRSDDRQLQVDMYGPQRDVSSGKISLTAKLANGALPALSANIVSMLLGNLFPRWDARESWLTKSFTQVGSNGTASTKTVVGRSTLEMKYVGGSIVLSITPTFREIN